MSEELLKDFAKFKGWTLHKSGLYENCNYCYKLTLDQIYREFR